MLSPTAIVRSWHQRLGIAYEADFSVGPVESAALPLADAAPDGFLHAMLDRALLYLDAEIVAFVSREVRTSIGSDGSTPVLPAGLEWCSERTGRMADRDSPLIGPSGRAYIVAQCDRGWFIAAGAKLNPRQLTAYARIAGALWWSARERAATAHAAATDSMTGLFNRLGLAQSIERLPPRQELVVMYLDLDGLKEANDKGGHALGDALIIKCAGVLQSTVREGDIVARVGGDEFVVIALGEQPEQVKARVRGKLDRASVSCSIGVVGVPSEVATIAEASLEADERMYHDKYARTGRGRPGR